jgi:twinkle protein
MDGSSETSFADEGGSFRAGRDWVHAGSTSAIPKRGIDEATCQRYGYLVGEYEPEEHLRNAHGKYAGLKCHIASHRDASGTIAVQNIRIKGKQFVIRGDSKQFGFWGQHLFSRGKYLTITEGELDALSVAQAFGLKWPVVSLPHGVKSAKKCVQRHYEWLDGFDQIVLMLDMDEQGRECAAEMAEMLPAGKVKIASLPMKDANECLMAGQVEAIVRAFWDARPYRPDGIVMASDLRAVLMTDPPVGIPYPWEGLTRLTRGIRGGELVTITAGSGIGKTTLMKEIAYHLHLGHEKSIGMLMLEESNRKTLEGLVGLHLNKNIIVDRSKATPEEIMLAFDTLFVRDVAIYDHFGSTDVDNIVNRLRYMSKAAGVQFAFLDHISIMVSGNADNDERRTIDAAMTKLRTLVEETGMGLFLISHLKRPQGDKGHEDGAQIRLGQLRGSHAIVQLSDIAIGLQKPEDDTGGDTVEAVVLKNRFTGERGSAGLLQYNRDTGRLTESVF